MLVELEPLCICDNYNKYVGMYKGIGFFDEVDLRDCYPCFYHRMDKLIRENCILRWLNPD